MYEAVFERKPSIDHAVARLCLLLHKTPEEIRAMPFTDTMMILAAHEFDQKRQSEST